MTGKFLLMVSDDEEGDRGEVVMLDTAQETERKIASLMAAGVDGKRIRVFTGGQTGLTITHRPVVRLAPFR
jgi:hypothetical protein